MQRPRLLVLNQYYRPGVEADGRLLAQLCEGLAQEWDVTVITGAVPGAESGRQRLDGVDVLRVPSATFQRRRLALRAANYLSYFALAGAEGLAARPPDVVYCLTNPPFVGDLAYVVARRFRAPLVITVMDVFPETAVVLGRMRSAAAVGALRALVGFYLRRADRVVAIGETMRRRLEESGIPPERIRVIPNWVDTEAVRPSGQDNAWGRAHGLAGKFVTMHSGNVGYAQDLDTLVRAARLVGGVEVVVVGDGARRAELQELSSRLGAGVRFLPHQPDEMLSESLSSAAVHVVGLARGLAGYVVPSRVYGILAAGRPVIAAVDQEAETARLVRDAGCGVVVPPGEPEALAGAIRRFRDGELDGEALGRRGRAWVVAEGGRDAALARYRALFEEVRRS